MKDNRWLLIDDDLLDETINSKPIQKIRFRRLLIASIASILSICTLLIFLIPSLSDLPIIDELSNDLPNENSLPEIDINEILSGYSGLIEPWNNGTDLKLVTLSGEQKYYSSGSNSNSSSSNETNDSIFNQSIDVTLSEMPNVKLDRFTSGRYIDMTGRGFGRYDWDGESTGIYLDVITNEFFSLQDEIRFALMGEELDILEDEFLLLQACSNGIFRFSKDDIEHETLYFGIIEGEISYSEAIATLDNVPDGFGFSKIQEDAIRRYFRGEEINVGAEFSNDKAEQELFNFYLMTGYHSLLERRCGHVNIHEFGTNEGKCFFTREHWIKGGSGVFKCDFGIYDRVTKEITLITGDIDSSILFNLTLFGSEFRVNDDYTMLAYIDTSDGSLCLIDALNGKFFSGTFSAFTEENNNLNDDSQIVDEPCEHSDLCDCASEEIIEDVENSVYNNYLGIGVIGKINFSPNDKYVYCKLNTEKEAWLFLDTQGNFATTIYGKYVKFVSGGHAIIIETEKGLRILDVKTKTDITDHYGVMFSLSEHEIHSFFETNGKIVWKNLINGEEIVIATEYDAFLTDKNSGCVYVFTKSDKTLKGYSASDGECKYVAIVGDDFVNGAPENAIFNLLLDGSEKLLLISYYTPLSLEFDESKFQKLKGEYWDIGGDISSIPDYAYIYIRSIKYNGSYLDCYDSDDVNGEVLNVNYIGKYLLFEDILSFAKDDMIIDYSELVKIGHLFAERIEPYIVIDSMNRVKVIPEALTEFFGYELNTGDYFFWNIYLPATMEYSVDCGKEYIANMVNVNVNNLSGNNESDELNEFKQEITKELEKDYKTYLHDGYYRMKYEIKLQIRDRIVNEYQKRFG